MLMLLETILTVSLFLLSPLYSEIWAWGKRKWKNRRKRKKAPKFNFGAFLRFFKIVF